MSIEALFFKILFSFAIVLSKKMETLYDKIWSSSFTMCILVIALKQLHHKSMMSEAEKLTGKKQILSKFENNLVDW